MRILHTSDWHLGRSFHREGMLAHQAAYVDHLLDVVATERADLVVVSGDVYDRALPHVDAVRLADETLARLAASRAKVVLTSGNHDSAQRLGFSSRLIDAAGVFIRTDAAGVGTPVGLADEDGPVAVYGLPFLDPLALAEPWRLPVRSHQAALSVALDRVRRDLATRPSGTRSVVLAHAFVGGGVPSDSERDICVGGVDLVPAAVFDGVDYVALGHLHRPQTLTPRLRYSGSPLAYSFGEAGQQKQAWLVELDRCGLAEVRAVPLPTPRPLTVLTGTLEELLADPDHAAAEGNFVSARLTDAVRPADPMRRLQSRFRHCVHLEWTGSTAITAGRSYQELLRGRSDMEVVGEFVSRVRTVPATEAERSLLGQALAAAARAEAAE